MTHGRARVVAAALLILPAAARPGLPPAAEGSPVVLVQGADAARRELQRQQRVTECQNRVFAQQSRYASQAEFLRARQACAAAR